MQKGLNVITAKGITLAKLYNTLVADIVTDFGGTHIKLDNGGWVTRSTAKAMNTALKQHGLSLSVVTRKGTMGVLDSDNKFVPFTGTTYNAKLN